MWGEGMKLYSLICFTFILFLSSCGVSQKERNLQYEVDKLKREAKYKDEAIQRENEQRIKKEQLDRDLAASRAKAREAEIKRRELLSKQTAARKLAEAREKKKAQDLKVAAAKKSKAKSDPDADNIRSKMADILAAPHGDLPQTQRGRINHESPDTVITIKNDTDYLLTITYVGATVLERVITAGDSRKIYLEPGKYDVSATVAKEGVIPFAGKKSLQKAFYDSSFYIVTTRR